MNIITFDVDAAISDLLSDSNITNQSSTIFDDGNEDDPFIIKEKNYYDDIDQSGVYQETYKAMISDPSKELLTPLIVYLDETFLDSFSKLVLHPVVITFKIIIDLQEICQCHGVQLVTYQILMKALQVKPTHLIKNQTTFIFV